MSVALALVVIGLCAPYLLHRMSARGPTSIVIAAHLAVLVLVWLGLLDIAVGAAGLSHRLVRFCSLALHDPPTEHDPRTVLVVTVVIAAMLGRAVHLWWRTAKATRRTRRRLFATATGTEDDITFTPLGSVACTVGLLRPHIFVDNTMFHSLTPCERTAVLAHERGHVHGYHGLINLTVGCVAAGLAPLPGARLAQQDVRRLLEAHADDRAASRTSRRAVATAIVAAATLPPQPALGAAGWSSWRVDRLLDPFPHQRRTFAAMAIVLTLISAMTLIQTVGHALAGIHLVPMTFPAV